MRSGEINLNSGGFCLDDGVHHRSLRVLRKFHDSTFAVQDGFEEGSQVRKVAPCGTPDDLGLHAEVLVDELVSHRNHRPPGDLCGSPTQLARDAMCHLPLNVEGPDNRLIEGA